MPMLAVLREHAGVGQLVAEALIIVDAQAGFLTGTGALPNAVDLVAHLEAALKHARRAGSLVVFLQNDGSRGAVDEPGRPGWALHVHPVAGEPVLRKTVDDGFAETHLAELLLAHSVRRVTVAGLLSDMCASATARTASALGFRVVLPRDGHSTCDLGDIPAGTVARVAEHALGDEVDLVDRVEAITFAAPTNESPASARRAGARAGLVTVVRETPRWEPHPSSSSSRW